MKTYLYTILIFSVVLSLAFIKLANAKSGHTIVLTKQNALSLNMDINGQTASTLQRELMEKAGRLRPKDPIYLVLNSPGGSVVDGQKIIETARGIPNDINTITVFSASMSFILSQYLNKRLILESGTMMSHRATAGGLSGQVPGSLITRALALLASISEIEAQVAARAHIPLDQYQNMIRDELWLTGVKAVQKGFADQVVRVSCDPSLSGPGKTESVQILLFKVKVTWNACPLITEPYTVEFENEVDPIGRAKVLEVLYNKAAWARGIGFVSPYAGQVYE